MAGAMRSRLHAVKPTGTVAIGCAISALAVAAFAHAAEPPDSATVIRLQSAADSAWRVRVVTNRATYLLIAPRMDAQGVTISKQDNPPALITPRDFQPTEKRVAWAEVERLDTERSAVGRGALRGVLAGAAIGGLAVLTSDSDSEWSGSGWTILSITLSALLGGGIGALMGFGTGISSPLYP